MSTIDFTGRVAIVTGAGRGVGRAYALELARRGSRVIVNDTGVDLTGGSESVIPAEEVAATIRESGGEAIADTTDVAAQDAGTAIVETALSTWGRVDVLINNAGIPGAGALLADLQPAAVERVLSINLGGAVRLCRAVWPHMRSARYGRIINITSHSVFGTSYTAPYITSRAASIGLTTALAQEGKPDNIRVNCVLPAAMTRMTAGIPNAEFLEVLRSNFPAEAVVPAVVLLASEQAPCTGQVFHSGGGLVARVALAVGPGVVGLTTAEEVLDRFGEVSAMGAEPVFPANVDEMMAHVFARALGVAQVGDLLGGTTSETL